MRTAFWMLVAAGAVYAAWHIVGVIRFLRHDARKHALGEETPPSTGATQVRGNAADLTEKRDR